MHRLAKLTVLAGLLAAVGTTPVYAHDRDDDRGPKSAHAEHRSEHAGKRSALRIALWGDEFYNDDPQLKSVAIEQTLNSMNQHKLDFTIFVGDTKNGHTPCTDAAIGQDVVYIFNRLKAPTLYSVGDNEWTDCHRTNNGSFDPLDRLDYLRSVFFAKNTTQGKHPLEVQRQGELGQAYSENSRFVANNVEFVALHIPGSNNNLVATANQCSKNSTRTQADCDAASAEYRARNERNIAWLKEAFADAREHGYAGILIAIQADIYRPFDIIDGSYRNKFLPGLNAANGYADFFHTLVEQTQSFAGKVVLVHGDSHYFRVDKPMFNADGRLTGNFTRAEVFGSKDNSWVEMTVDPSTENVFSFAPVILQ